MLFDGAAVSGRMDRDTSAAKMARLAAETLLDAALLPSRSGLRETAPRSAAKR
jgi:hypothetical protein